MNLHVGTSGYSYKEWKGSFYPATLPATRMLHFYAERFRTVEINSTFFAVPKVATLEQWAAQVGDDFRFAFKAPKSITHAQPLQNKGDVLAKLLAALGMVQSHLGPILFQLPPTLKKDTPRLAAFLTLLPESCRPAFEFRHPTWFEEGVFALLRDHGAALCIADADDELVVPFAPTAGWGYLRLRRLAYDGAALKAWLDRIRGANWTEAFVYFKHDDEGNGPRFAQQLIELAG